MTKELEKLNLVLSLLLSKIECALFETSEAVISKSP